MTVRPAMPAEIGALARLWYDGWQDAHAAILPEALARARTRKSFEQVLGAAIGDTYVVGLAGTPLGFYVLRGDELYQFYVAAEARGTDVAGALIADAEARLAERAVKKAWLACAIGNERAARFYEKHGWRRAGTVVSRLDTANGPFDLEIWRYEKQMALDEEAG